MTDLETKAGDLLARMEPEQAPERLLAGRRKDLAHWRKFGEGQAAQAGPAAREGTQIVALLDEFLEPALERLGGLPTAAMMLNLMVPFDIEGGLEDFVAHFFQFEPGDFPRHSR